MDNYYDCFSFSRSVIRKRQMEPISNGFHLTLKFKTIPRIQKKGYIENYLQESLELGLDNFERQKLMEKDLDSDIRKPKVNSNGNVLNDGDNVTAIKDLKVKRKYISCKNRYRKNG